MFYKLRWSLSAKYQKNTKKIRKKYLKLNTEKNTKKIHGGGCICQPSHRGPAGKRVGGRETPMSDVDELGMVELGLRAGACLCRQQLWRGSMDAFNVGDIVLLAARACRCGAYSDGETGHARGPAHTHTMVGGARMLMGKRVPLVDPHMPLPPFPHVTPAPATRGADPCCYHHYHPERLPHRSY